MASQKARTASLVADYAALADYRRHCPSCARSKVESAFRPLFSVFLLVSTVVIVSTLSRSSPEVQFST